MQKWAFSVVVAALMMSACSPANEEQAVPAQDAAAAAEEAARAAERLRLENQLKMDLVGHQVRGCPGNFTPVSVDDVLQVGFSAREVTETTQVLTVPATFAGTPQLRGDLTVTYQLTNGEWRVSSVTSANCAAVQN